MTASLADIPRSQRASGKESIGFGLKKLPSLLRKKKTVEKVVASPRN